MQDESLKIDVGEADEQETEIDLDAEPKQEEPKEEIVVQEAKEEEVVEEQPKAEEPKDELSEYRETVKKRIAKLTRKMREAERQKEEAIEFAKKQKDEAEQLRKRYATLDTSYTEEFEKRVTTNVDAAKVKLANAIAAGNIEEQVAAQTEIAQLAMDANRLAKLKDVQTAVPAETPVEQPAAPVAPKVDPRADEWATKNPWFGTDNAMTYTAFDIHKKLVEEEGFDPSSDEYYSEVDKRIRLEFPHKFDNVEQSTKEQPVQNVASAKRPAAKGRRKTVKLTPSQVAISKRLGVPLEEYAKQLAAKEV
jgi:molybdopterin converting factor small subunit